MPVHNAREYVEAAVSSVLHQTYSDLELIIIDDGSNDGTAELLERYAAADRRVRLIRRTNRGVTESLNEALDLARADYVARMDADDISLSHRLATELNYLERHPKVGIVGAWVKYIDENSQLDKLRTIPILPLSPPVVQWFLMFGNCIFHPTVMARRSTLQHLGSYRNEAKHSEDLDLWLRACRVTQIANVPEVLLHYRTYWSSISSQHAGPQAELARSLRAQFISDTIGIDATPESLEVLEPRLNKQVSVPTENYLAATQLILEMYRRYCQRTILRPAEKNQIALDALRRIALLTLDRRVVRLADSLRMLRSTHPILWEALSPRSIQTLTATAQSYFRIHRQRPSE